MTFAPSFFTNLLCKNEQEKPTINIKFLLSVIATVIEKQLRPRFAASPTPYSPTRPFFLYDPVFTIWRASYIAPCCQPQQYRKVVQHGEQINTKKATPLRPSPTRILFFCKEKSREEY